MNAFETIIYEKTDGIASVILNRPQALNRYNIKMRDEMFDVLSAIRDDPDVRVVIFKGAGERAFCVGADLTEFGTAPSPLIARQVRWERDVWGLFASMKQPLIAAIHGYVLGSGTEIALLCDIRIASDDAVFGLPEVSLGMIPAAGGSQTLPRILGRGRALQLLFCCDRVDAQEALRIGLVNKVVKRAELLPAAYRIADDICSCNHIAVRCAKEAVRRGLDLPLDEGLALERRLTESVSLLYRDVSSLEARESV